MFNNVESRVKTYKYKFEKISVFLNVGKSLRKNSNLRDLN